MRPRGAGRKPNAGIGHSPMRPRFPRAAAVIAASSMAVHGCGGDSSSEEPSLGAVSGVPTVLATTGIWADIVSNVVCGDLASVETIIPVGGDPHGFEPSLQDRARMERADLVVANGLDLEDGLEDTLEAVAESGTPVFEFAEEIEAIPYSFEFGHNGEEGESHDEDEGEEGEGHDEDEGHDEEEGEEGEGHDEEEGYGRGGDPHVWFDPQRVSGALPALAVRLAADAGLDADAVAECLAVYQAELAGVAAEIVEMVSRLAPDQRTLVTNHDALGYFADRYGLEIVGTVIPVSGTMGQTNPAQLEELAEIIEHEGVTAIFAETLHSTDDADALASRVGDIEVVTLHTGSLGPPGSGAETYLGFMRANAQLIVDGLG